MAAIAKTVHVSGSRGFSGREILAQALQGLIAAWRDYRRQQYTLRRLYLNSPEAHHIPWRVWRAHAAMLKVSEERYRTAR